MYKWHFVWVLPMVILAVVACSGAAPSTSQQGAAPATDVVSVPEASPTSAPTSTPLPEPTSTPEPVELTGRGDTLTSVFNLGEGLLFIEATHGGSSNFIVQVLPEDGSPELSVNTIGSYSGRRGHAVSGNSIIGLKPGPHRVEVKADGQWSLKIWQPGWSSGQQPPITQEGRGDWIIAPVQLDSGTTPASFTHNGGSNFIVSIVSIDGENTDLLINEIGAYEGTVAIRAQRAAFIGLEPGIHVIIIQADGDWTAQIGE